MGSVTESATIHRPRAAPSPPATEIAAGLRLVVNRLARRMRQEADAGIGISLLSALAVIDGAGRVTLGELAASEQVQPPTMTRIAAALEGRGLVVREADPSDGRVAWLRLSADGRRFLDRTRGRKNAYVARRLRDFSDEDRRVLARAVSLMERLVDQG
jgi:DNA-binding MarR family transcriptional regulator